MTTKREKGSLKARTSAGALIPLRLLPAAAHLHGLGTAEEQTGGQEGTDASIDRDAGRWPAGRWVATGLGQNRPGEGSSEADDQKENAEQRGLHS